MLLWWAAGTARGGPPPGATVFTAVLGGSGRPEDALRVEPGVQPGAPAPRVRLAYTVERDGEGRPLIQAYAFLLGSVAFSRMGGTAPWPALCEFQWGWSGPAGGLVRQASSGLMRSPGCALRGRVGVTGFLSPRVGVHPVLAVTVEGARGTVSLPARVVLHDPRKVSWTGVPVVLADLSTTSLEDGTYRLRVAGGFRELEVDGDPGTPVFEDGGDATVEFTVNNHPPRLVSLAVLAGAATVYRGAWAPEGPAGAERLVLHRTGGGMVPPADTATARIVLEFSVPVAGVAVVARREGGGVIRARVAPGDPADPYATGWTASIPWKAWRPGAWRLRVTAMSRAGDGLERLAGDPVPFAALSTFDPGTGACAAGAAPCRTGADESHRVRIGSTR